MLCINFVSKRREVGGHGKTSGTSRAALPAGMSLQVHSVAPVVACRASITPRRGSGAPSCPASNTTASQPAFEGIGGIKALTLMGQVALNDYADPADSDARILIPETLIALHHHA